MIQAQAMTGVPLSARIKHLPAASPPGRALARLGGLTDRPRRPAILSESGATTDEDLDTTSRARPFDWLAGDPGYRIHAPCDLVAGRAPLDADGILPYRTCPFTAFNSFAIPPRAGGKAETGERQ